MIPIHVSVIICSLYLLATLLFLSFLKSFRMGSLRLGRWVLTLGVMAHWGELIAFFKQTSVFLPTTTPQSHLVVTGFIASACLFMSARRSALLVIVLLLPIISLSFVFLHWLGEPSEVVLMPTPWIWVHVLLMLLGEAFFCFAAAASVVYLVAESKLRRRDFSQFFARMPSLPAFDQFLQELLWAGFGFLALGLIMGILFAHQFWTGGWWLDPKVLFCMTTLAWYAVVIALRWVSKNFWGRRTALLSIVGFIAVIFLSLGVHHFFPTQHTGDEKTEESK